eukprot:TRINITY_DN16444_c0_g1_i1.p1 TRINITY_DN16444_c0_g1~~TRINITY_DN16444_c0_g1_i1.p1  ORF type:complete len:300 (+),score=64.69 TRINITY_DN16444_c0_g1_i1:354-1253(+)
MKKPVLGAIVAGVMLATMRAVFSFGDFEGEKASDVNTDCKMRVEDGPCYERTPRLLTGFESRGREAPLLWSYPGSGNSYLRLLVEQSTGLLTGSMYHKDEIMKEVFKGETHCDNTVIGIKSHKKVPKRCQAVEGTGRVALLVRHPMRTFFAEYSRKISTAKNRHIDGIDRDKFNMTNFTVVVKKMASEWVTQIPVRLATPRGATYHILRFEDLTHPKRGPPSLRSLLAFLDVCASLPSVKCAYKHSNNPAIRRSPTPNQVTLEEVLTDDLLDELWRVVAPVAVQYNYTKENWRKRKREG